MVAQRLADVPPAMVYAVCYMLIAYMIYDICYMCCLVRASCVRACLCVCVCVCVCVRVCGCPAARAGRVSSGEVPSARSVAVELGAGASYLQLVRNATAETFQLFQETHLESMAPFDSGILEIALDETELCVDLHRDGGCGIKAGEGHRSEIESSSADI